MNNKIVAIIPAAGYSSRMGLFKLLLPLNVRLRFRILCRTTGTPLENLLTIREE